LALRHGHMSVLEYKRRFYNLSLFAPHYVLTKSLIALQFKTMRELIEVVQALEACIGEGQQGIRVEAKREMRIIGGQSHSREDSSIGTDDHKSVDYPPCVKCGQRHLGDCSVSLGRCFVCRGKGHRWRNC